MGGRTQNKLEKRNRGRLRLWEDETPEASEKYIEQENRTIITKGEEITI